MSQKTSQEKKNEEIEKIKQQFDANNNSEEYSKLIRKKLKRLIILIVLLVILVIAYFCLDYYNKNKASNTAENITTTDITEIIWQI